MTPTNGLTIIEVIYIMKNIENCSYHSFSHTIGQGVRLIITSYCIHIVMLLHSMDHIAKTHVKVAIICARASASLVGTIVMRLRCLIN